MLKRVLLSTCIIFSASIYIQANAQANFKKLTNGVLITLNKNEQQQTHLLKLEVLSDQIIHVTATPESDFPENKISTLLIPRPIKP